MENLTWIETIYWAATIVGGILFLLRTVLFFIAGDADSLLDGDIDGDFDASHGDTDLSFKVLSLQSITAFFLMFGLSGLGLVDTELNIIWVILGSVLVGAFTVFVISILFTTFKRLQSDGTLRIENAIGKSGTVYLRLPANGTGQVRVSVQGSLKVFDATSANKEEIASGKNIKVVNIMGDRILVVEKMD